MKRKLTKKLEDYGVTNLTNKINGTDYVYVHNITSGRFKIAQLVFDTQKEKFFVHYQQQGGRPLDDQERQHYEKFSNSTGLPQVTTYSYTDSSQELKKGVVMKLYKVTLDKRDDPLKIDAFQSVVNQLCQGLKTIHAHGYTHGDIKADNIFFNDKSTPDDIKAVLGDFGHMWGSAGRTLEPGQLYARYIEDEDANTLSLEESQKADVKVLGMQLQALFRKGKFDMDDPSVQAIKMVLDQMVGDPYSLEATPTIQEILQTLENLSF